VIARATSGGAKAALETATSTARDLGIFGSPTFVTNGEIFWGDDRLEDVIPGRIIQTQQSLEDWIKDPRRYPKPQIANTCLLLADHQT
jgi:hypothetical protein